MKSMFTLDHDKVHREDSDNVDDKKAKASRFYAKPGNNLEMWMNPAKKAIGNKPNKCPVHRTLEEDIIIETRFKDQPNEK